MRILEASARTMTHYRGSGELDEAAYDALRAAWLGAGAENADLEALAYYLVCEAVTTTASDERHRQFELISDHLVCTVMKVTVTRSAPYVRVDFPGRLRLQ
jgi:hypothetical protein